MLMIETQDERVISSRVSVYRVKCIFLGCCETPSPLNPAALGALCSLSQRVVPYGFSDDPLCMLLLAVSLSLPGFNG